MVFACSVMDVKWVFGWVFGLLFLVEVWESMDVLSRNGSVSMVFFFLFLF